MRGFDRGSAIRQKPEWVANGSQNVGRAARINIPDSSRLGQSADHRSKHENGAVMIVFCADRFETVTGQAGGRMDAAAEGRLQVCGLARNLRYQRSRGTPHLRMVSTLR